MQIIWEAKHLSVCCVFSDCKEGRKVKSQTLQRETKGWKKKTVKSRNKKKEKEVTAEC